MTEIKNYIRSPSGIVYYRKQDVPSVILDCISARGFSPHPLFVHSFVGTVFKANPVTTASLFQVAYFNRGTTSRDWILGSYIDGAIACSGLCLIELTELDIAECIMFLAPGLMQHGKSPVVFVYVSDNIRRHLTFSGEAGMWLDRINDWREFRCLAPTRRKMTQVKTAWKEK